MKRITLAWALTLCSFITFIACSSPDVGERSVSIIPAPAQMTVGEGTFTIHPGIEIGYADESLKGMGELLSNEIEKLSGIKLASASDKESNCIIFLELTDPKEFADLPKAYGLSPKDSVPVDESYSLSIQKRNIYIKATTLEGIYRGITTLKQIVGGNLQPGGEKIYLPLLEVKDSPRFAWRGLSFDVSRCFFDPEEVKQVIDMIALYKMNVLHMHLSDNQGWRIEIKKYPKLTEIGSKREKTLVDYYYVNYPQVFDGIEHGGYYTQEQIKEVVAYAASKYINVIPEIEMPGHALAALAAYPELSCDSTQTYKVSPTWGVFEQVFCPSETTFKFFEGVMDEVVELFPSEYIHIGGDECPKTAWKNSAFCQQLIRQLGLKDDVTPSKVDGMKHSKEDKLQSYFVTRMEKYLNGKGRNIIGWDEILEGGLAPNATVLSWRGVEGGLNAAKAGHNAIMAPMPYAYLDFYQEDPEIAPTTIGGYTTLKKTYSYNPVPDDADELVKKHIIGMQGNLWREYMKTSDRVDYQAFPRAMAIAETGWTLDANKNWKSFCERMVTEFERLEVMDTKPCLNFFDVNINTHADENGPLMVLLETFYPNAEIRYTTDGSEPTYGSTLYEQPFALEGNIDLKAAAFKDGKMLGKVTNKPLYGNLLAGKPFTVNYTMGWTGDIFGDNDVLGADKTTFGLTNGKRGNNASYTPWSSFAIVEGKDLEFIVHLDKPTEVRKVVFGSLFNPAMRMLPAGGVAVEVSADGQQYTQIAEKVLKHDCPETGRIAFTDSIEFEPTQATFLKVKIKNGGTLRNGVNFEKNNGPEVIPAELWIDEIEAY